MSQFGQGNLVADSCRRGARMSGRITSRIVGLAAGNIARVVAEGGGSENKQELVWEEERRVQVDLLRDIFGNPFRPICFQTSWGSETILSLAAAAYDLRKLPDGTLEFDRLAVLADALEDAGCNEEAILEHLRSPSSHVRGCWAVDLVLRKE